MQFETYITQLVSKLQKMKQQFKYDMLINNIDKKKLYWLSLEFKLLKIKISISKILCVPLDASKKPS